MDRLQFDWDAGNIGHLRRHWVTPEEFEELLLNEPLELEYETETGEERYKSLGSTLKGRVLIAVWTVPGWADTAITAYPAARRQQRLWVLHRGA